MRIAKKQRERGLIQAIHLKKKKKKRKRNYQLLLPKSLIIMVYPKITFKKIVKLE